MDRHVKLPLAFALVGLVMVAGLFAIGGTSNPITHRFRERLYDFHLVKQYQDAQRGDLPGSIAEDTAMAALFPHRFQPYMYRAIAYGYQGRRSLAVADDTRSLNCIPTDRDLMREMPDCRDSCVARITGQLYYNRADDYENMGRHKLAIADADSALKVNPRMTDAHFVRAEANLALKEYRKAADDFDWTLQHHDVNYEHATFLVAQARAGYGDYKRAVEDMHRAINLRPDLHYLWSYLGWYQYKAGQVADAIMTDQKALAFPDLHDPCPALNLGLCYASMNDETRAHAAYAQGFQMSPTPQILSDARKEIAEEIQTQPGNPTMLKAQQWLNGN